MTRTTPTGRRPTADPGTAPSKDRLFVIALAVKTVDGALQGFAALLLLTVPVTVIRGTANVAVTRDMLGDPHRSLATHLLTAASRFPHESARYLAILALSVQAIVKLLLVAGMSKRVRYALPVALVIFGALLVDELVQFDGRAAVARLVFGALDAAVYLVVLRRFVRLSRDAGTAAQS
ncbi:MAG: DUF2127 domain-containing protein [Sciscionella sp.]